ncbi:right-handed parallel beta-helix repeat-containing protein [Kitasatospora gansuensis]
MLGGTWDMAGRTYQTQSDAIGFAHADGILVQDCVIKEVPDAHAVELYSVRRGRIVNCVFEGMYSTSAYRWMKEAVQITSATGEPNLPLDTPEVVTGCVDILVSGCTVRVPEAGANGADPVGPFAALCGDHGAGAVAHRGIRVIGNHIEGVLSDGIRAADWEDSVISGNTIVGAGNYGIRALSFADRQRTGLVITGNTIRNTSGEAAVQLSQYPGAVVGNNSIQGTKQAGTATNCQGIHLLNSPGAVVSENSLGGIDGDGIGIDGSDGAMITGNRIADCTHDGIAAGSNNLTIRQNSVTGVQPVAGGLYGRYGIRVYGTATNVSVQGNTVRRAPADTSPNPAATAVAIRATAAGTWVTGNDLRGFGSTTWDSKSTSTVLGENLVDAPPVL